MPAIVILSGSSLCHNPRVLKEACTLAAAGFEVEVLGAWLDGRLKEQDLQLLARAPFTFTPVLDLTRGGFAVKLSRWAHRVGKALFLWAHLANRWQLGLAAGPLGRAARRRRAALYIAHSESAMAVGCDLIAKGHKVALDMEDWFSQDLPPEAWRTRPVVMLARMERRLWREGAYVSCPSAAMSRAVAAEAGASKRAPAVVYNAFPWSDRRSIDGLQRDRRDAAAPSIHWYSQTLGPHRGLEDLLGALEHLRADAQVHLRGMPAPGFEAWLARTVQARWRGRIHLHGLVPQDELLSRIAEHDIGFAGELTFCRSRDLTVTNKILQYLQAGLAVVASDTQGQREVAEQAPGAVLLYPSGNSAALARHLDTWLGCAAALGQAKAAALAAAEQTFCWERQAPVLMRSVALAMEGAS